MKGVWVVYFPRMSLKICSKEKCENNIQGKAVKNKESVISTDWSWSARGENCEASPLERLRVLSFCSYRSDDWTRKMRSREDSLWVASLSQLPKTSPVVRFSSSVQESLRPWVEDVGISEALPLTEVDSTCFKLNSLILASFYGL